MCGIVGYIGQKQAQDILVNGLKKLEYRGYDSAGVAIDVGGSIVVSKSVGRLKELESKINGTKLLGFRGIGHTRWATHGRPSDENSHPHFDCTEKFVVVHNGIIENYAELREELKALGHEFKSETDTEVISHLIEELYNGNLLETFRMAVARLEGSYACAVMSEDEKDKIIVARKDSPLVVGIGVGENFIASDIPAILEHTRNAYILDDYEIAVLTADSVDIFDRQGKHIKKSVFEVKWDAVSAEKGGYDHFMLKEIDEQPKALKDTLRGRIDEQNQKIKLEEVKLTAKELQDIQKIHIVACGTAYHAGLVGKYAIEQLVRIPVEVEVASEFRYRNPILNEKTLVMVISQSGETADTLAALRLGKAAGSRVAAITNVVGSSVSREADDVIYTWAGPEIAVASTKAYTTQLLAVYMFALYMAEIRQTISEQARIEIYQALQYIPEQAARILADKDHAKKVAQGLIDWNSAFFIGRGMDYTVALEGALKLKEISYIHAEAYAAGELKHGTIALIEEGIPVISLLTQPDVYEKTMSNVIEVKARDAKIIAVVNEGDVKSKDVADELIEIPKTHPILTPILSVIPLQLISYYASVLRGNDVDKPRNLAKSVTVE
ncbi:glutamine--fructose-6-phosphate transaminase (isomerizing) [Desulfuribacillus alkaliarsenatis]|uniref:Glutamine--fructose-6-phosphate aminotransferase [isomerizing] n=1 Tax=Desulfuribacillus alkaliarsenatis TaxID=766136 RepID=A0A1E5G3N6_9FIRM|nr:glutamine--fructose-6-phosphate transaminase (isomerizing) [Desulfuribacillus alkaliarsenatis]OEF97670.1 glutamine--fructose-6-phosphate aminotransferase [Desulfuribacillus alkaliarsenatis]